MVLAVVVPVLLARSMSLSDIVAAQSGGRWFLWWPPGPGLVAGILFLLASLAEGNRIPFDIPEAESELVSGVSTEYTGMKFGMLMLSEYAGIIAFSGLASVLFLGGYRPLPFLAFIPPPLWMAAKIGLLTFLIIWLRVTYPRLREDQLQRFSWIALIPITLVDILVTAVVKVAVK